MPKRTDKTLTPRQNRMAQLFARQSEALCVAGISQRAQARDIGWTAGTLNQYLLGNNRINYEAMFTLCDYYRISPFDVDPELWGRLMAVPPGEIAGRRPYHTKQ